MAVITVVGAGMMGSAWCVPMVDAGHEVRLVGTHLDREIVQSLKESGVHPKLALELPRAIQPFFAEELAAAIAGAEVLGVGVSSAGVRWAGEKLAPFVRPDLPVASITKGLEWDGSELSVLPDVLESCFPPALRGKISPAAIAGPCIAGELARRVETAVVVTGRDPEKLRKLAQTLSTPYYHVLPESDLAGVEACAALKNAYAMGIAFAIGLHEKRGGAPGSVAMHNYESAVFAQSVREMGRIIQLMGGDPASAAGLAGVGDLDVTTNGGRTGRFGRLLGLGLPVAEAIEKMQGATLECLEILEVMRHALGGFEASERVRRGELPLLRHLAEVALDGKAVNVPFSEFFRD
jgi:glycerol-3-phosphate dehydrogenase (NAD(P)+)